jgi:hypothetical protein
VVGTCECGNEPLGSINCGEFLDKVRTGQLLKKDSDVWSKDKGKGHAQNRPRRPTGVPGRLRPRIS